MKRIALTILAVAIGCGDGPATIAQPDTHGEDPVAGDDDDDAPRCTAQMDEVSRLEQDLEDGRACASDDECWLARTIGQGMVPVRWGYNVGPLNAAQQALDECRGSHHDPLCSGRPYDVKCIANRCDWVDEPIVGAQVDASYVEATAEGSRVFGWGRNALYRSDDGGVTWAVKLEPLSNHRVAFSPHRPDELVVFSVDHRYVSLDAGESWTVWPKVTSPAMLNEHKPVMSPTGRGLILAKDNDALYRSTDHGATWSVVAVGAPVTGFPTFASDGTALVFVAGPAVATSQDAGATWSLQPTSFGTYDADPPTRMYVSPNDAGRWLAIRNHQGPLLRTEDAGASWSSFSDTLSIETHPRCGATFGFEKIAWAPDGERLWTWYHYPGDYCECTFAVAAGSVVAESATSGASFAEVPLEEQFPGVRGFAGKIPDVYDMTVVGGADPALLVVTASGVLRYELDGS